MGGGGLPRNQQGLPYYIEVFWDIPHEKNLEKILMCLPFLC